MNYAYASLSQLRQSGVTTADYSDTEALRLIRLYSDRFNKITGKVFAPTTLLIKADGGDKLYKITASPILKVLGVTVVQADYTRMPLSGAQYDILDNTLVKFNTELRRGLANVEFSLVEGILESIKEVEVEITSTITSGITEFTVANASDLEVRDILVFGRNMIIINDIDYVTNTIKIDDPGNIPPVAIGTKITCYGQVPLQVEEAIKLFVKNHKTLQTQKNGITSERIGNYQYTKDISAKGITGISEIDSILFLFINDEFEITFL